MSPVGREFRLYDLGPGTGPGIHYSEGKITRIQDGKVYYLVLLEMINDRFSMENSGIIKSIPENALRGVYWIDNGTS